MAAGSHLGGSGKRGKGGGPARLTCGAGSRGGAAGEPPPGGRPGRIPPAAAGAARRPRPEWHVAPMSPGRAGGRSSAAGQRPYRLGEAER